MITFDQEQESAYDVAMQGYDEYICGVAGVGKTYVMRKIIEDLRAQGKKVVVSAYTMPAALNLDDNGNTIFGIFNTYPDGLYFNNEGMKRLRRSDAWNADVIIVDEISMCPKGLFDYLYKAIKKISLENNKRPIQFIVCGDFFQLPPINENGVPVVYAFESTWWNKCGFKNVMLKTSHRQEGSEYFNRLCEIRQGINLDNNLEYLKKNAKYLQKNEDAVSLCPYRDDVKEKNDEKIMALEGQASYYNAKTDNPKLLKKMRVWESIMLKRGALVMATYNDPKGKYYNGLTGHIVDMKNDSVVVEFVDSTIEKPHIEEIGYHIWETEIKGVKHYAEQLAVIPAYSLTIHKAQGCTLDCVNVDPRCFADGQLYVALSRVKDVKRLYITNPIEKKHIMVNQKVRDFYKNLQLYSKEDIELVKEMKLWLDMGA